MVTVRSRLASTFARRTEQVSDPTRIAFTTQAGEYHGNSGRGAMIRIRRTPARFASESVAARPVANISYGSFFASSSVRRNERWNGSDWGHPRYKFHRTVMIANSAS